jgi:hypothetical protein
MKEDGSQTTTNNSEKSEGVKSNVRAGETGDKL